MSKKTIKPRRLMFFATFFYGLLFWCLLLVALICFFSAAIIDENAGFAFTIGCIFLALAVGVGFLRKVRRKSLSLKLPIEPKDLPYTADEVKHYLGLQENDTFAEEYYAMCQAYLTMKKSKMIQIITSIEKNTELRTASKNWISTAETKMDMLDCPVLYLKQAVPILLGCDRTTYYLYPHFVLRLCGKKDISAVSYTNFDLSVDESSCILDYNEKVPRDTEETGRAYDYSNKDGSPDMRVKNNPSRPIIRTADIESDNFGVFYQLSNYRAAEEFYSKYREFASKAVDAENLKRALNEAARQVQHGKIAVNENEE